MVKSRQTLSESDRKTVADWAADCAERVLFLFGHHSRNGDSMAEAARKPEAMARGARMLRTALGPAIAGFLE